jgi:glycosyltransferase involved in cell wall biosynthesis
MRVLVLTPRPPWPAVDGGRVAMARIAESLAGAGAVVEILSLDPRKHRNPAVAPPLPMERVGIDTSRALGPALRAIRRRTPMLVERFVSTQFVHALRKALQRFRPDLVQIESPFLVPYAGVVREAGRVPMVLRAQNVEFRIWESLAAHERNPLLRFALQRVAASLREYEVAHLDIPDAVVPISAADGDDFRRLGCTRPMHVAPCGVTLSELPPVAHDPLQAGFIGSLGFRPNQEAVAWIAGELWPRVLALEPEARLSIAGSSPPQWLRKRARGRQIEFHGAVDDAQAFLRRMAVIIAPLFSGGGMRIKVLEAMALARPVVATALGAGGIEVTPGQDIVIAGDVESFAGAVVSLLRDPEAAARIGEAARQTVATRYDNDAIGRDLLRFYESL